ncbi:MAG: DUF4296 domain-containing protein [Rhodothermaceae bacterium]|nr:DUF4296 domain-containing protein [Rhodothermaceae bacterium]
MRYLPIRYLPVGLILTALLMISCSDQKPDDLIGEEDFINLLVEFELLRTLQRTEADSLRTAEITRAVLDRYGITFEQFERSNEYYLSDTEVYRNLYREAIEQLNMEIGRLRAPDPE